MRIKQQQNLTSLKNKVNNLMHLAPLIP